MSLWLVSWRPWPKTYYICILLFYLSALPTISSATSFLHFLPFLLFLIFPLLSFLHVVSLTWCFCHLNQVTMNIVLCFNFWLFVSHSCLLCLKKKKKKRRDRNRRKRIIYLLYIIEVKLTGREYYVRNIKSSFHIIMCYWRVFCCH